MRDRFSEHGQIIAFALLFSLIVFVIADFTTGENEKSTGRVVEKHYREERVYATLETSMDSQGNVISTPVIKHDPPAWILFVQTVSGDVIRIDCRPAVYYSKNTGDPLEYITWFGGVSHIPYMRTALKTEGY